MNLGKRVGCALPDQRAALHPVSTALLVGLPLQLGRLQKLLLSQPEPCAAPMSELRALPACEREHTYQWPAGRVLQGKKMLRPVLLSTKPIYLS